MAMSKQDFIALADAIKAHNATAYINTRMGKPQIEMLADFCQKQNPAFKRDRWLDYIAGRCGKNGGPVK